VTRQGWLSLFTAAVLVADTAVLPLLCLAALPAWLLVTGRAPMRLPLPGERGAGPVPGERGAGPVPGERGAGPAPGNGGAGSAT
jgi:hypothetical protein